MKIDAKSYKVTILDKQFSLVSDEPERHIIEAAALVDTYMKNMQSNAGGRIDTEKIAILTALQLASKYLYMQESVEKRRREESDLVAKIERQLSSL